MSAVMYDSAVEDFARGRMDWETDPVKVMLVTDDYQPSQTHDATLDDLRGFEVAVSGTYQRGGGALRDRMVVRGDVANEVRLEGGSVAWGGVTAQFRYAIIYRPNGDNGHLVAYADLGRQEATNARVTLEYDDGVAEFSVASDGRNP